MITAETEIATVEEHLLACPACVARAEASDRYIDRLRTALVRLKG